MRPNHNGGTFCICVLVVLVHPFIPCLVFVFVTRCTSDVMLRWPACQTQLGWQYVVTFSRLAMVSAVFTECLRGMRTM